MNSSMSYAQLLSKFYIELYHCLAGNQKVVACRRVVRRTLLLPPRVQSALKNLTIGILGKAAVPLATLLNPGNPRRRLNAMRVGNGSPLSINASHAPLPRRLRHRPSLTRRRRTTKKRTKRTTKRRTRRTTKRRTRRTNITTGRRRKSGLPGLAPFTAQLDFGPVLFTD